MKNTSWMIGPDGTPGPALRACLQAAIAAPSIHNTQPWRFRPHEGGIDVYADTSRQLDVLDPTGRELMISVGAAVFNLRVAVLDHGRTPALHLLPDPGQPTLAARVTPGTAATGSVTVSRLARAIRQRHTSRRPFTATPVPQDVIDDLVPRPASRAAT